MITYKAGDFEGSLDELITGIRAHRINIYKIPIAEITEQFLELLSQLQKSMLIDDLSSFYSSASYLCYLKSKMLLPGVIEEDDERDEDMRERVVDALEKLKFSRYMVLLEEYKKKHEIDMHRHDMFFRIPLSSQDLFEGVTVEKMRETFVSLMKKAREREIERLKEENKEDEINEDIFNPYEKVTVNEKYTYLLELFEDDDKVLFTTLCLDTESADHIVCAFFATIEILADKKACIETIEDKNDFYIIKRIYDK